MSSVTSRIKEIKQPRGGFINPKQFSVNHIEDNITLNPENINAINIGLAVDYLTRFMTGSSKETAFDISIRGARNARDFLHCCDLLDCVNGLDNDSIFAACQLTGYDVAFRAGMLYFKPVDEIQPDTATIENVRTMVTRSLAFWKQYGPIIKDGFTFEGGYTHIINSGDGDFLTADTLWDFKVSATPPKSNHTLQLLIYYLMGKHSIHPEFKTITHLGIFNPRLNNVYLLDIDEIPVEVLETVASEVIGY